MNRVEHYCDRCGTQMTELDPNGDNNTYGITVLGRSKSDPHPVNVAMVVDTKIKHSCGSASARSELRGSEFCSIECFTEAMMELIKEVQEKTK